MTRLMSKQKVRLFELLEENYHILSGNPNRGNGEKTAVWEKIKNSLNELGPPKTTEKWRRVWTDIRKTLRKKVSLRQTYEINGAKVPNEFIFSESDLWVIRICGMDAAGSPNKIVKQEVTDNLDNSNGSSLRLVVEKPKRSSQRVSNRKCPKKQPQPQVEELTEDTSLLSPVLVFSDDKATQCSEDPPDVSPPNKKLRTDSVSLAASSEENPGRPEEDNKSQLKQLICLQKRQLSVTRQIHERQKCHNADQRQFNARVTNLLEEILQQLKNNQKTN